MIEGCGLNSIVLEKYLLFLGIFIQPVTFGSFGQTKEHKCILVN